MSYDVRRYRLPEDASPVDRLTLVVFKAWVTWLKPVLLVTFLMMIVSATVGTFIAKSGGFVGVWSPANYAAAALVGDPSSTMPTAAWTRGIVAQLVSVLAATTCAWPLLRKVLAPAEVAFTSGLLVVGIHLTLSHQWGAQPIAGASFGYQVAAVVSLWMLPVVAGAAGVVIGRSRDLETKGPEG